MNKDKRSGFIHDGQKSIPLEAWVQDLQNIQVQVEQKLTRQRRWGWINNKNIGIAASIAAVAFAFSVPEKSPLHIIRAKRNSK